MATSFSSFLFKAGNSDDSDSDPLDESDDHYGSPPMKARSATNRGARSGLRRAASPKIKQSTIQTLQRSYKHTAAERNQESKNRQKQRGQARVFKELDVTLEVLGLSEAVGEAAGELPPGCSPAGSLMPTDSVQSIASILSESSKTKMAIASLFRLSSSEASSVAATREEVGTLANRTAAPSSAVQPLKSFCAALLTPALPATLPLKPPRILKVSVSASAAATPGILLPAMPMGSHTMSSHRSRERRRISGSGRSGGGGVSLGGRHPSLTGLSLVTSLSPTDTASASWDALHEEHAKFTDKLSSVVRNRFPTADGDVEGVVRDVLSQAEDLKQRLIEYQTPQLGWQGIEECICRLGECQREGKLLLRELEPYRREVDDSYQFARSLFIPDLVGLVEIGALSISDSLERLKPSSEGRTAAASEADVKQANKWAGKLLEKAVAISREKLRSEVEFTSELEALDARLGAALALVSNAAAELSSSMATGLLKPESLAPGSFVHETSVQSKAVQAAWYMSSRISTRVGRFWIAQRIPLMREVCDSLLHAATLAVKMQENCLPCSKDEEEDLLAGCGGSFPPGEESGAWGRTPPAGTGCIGEGTIEDEDVQAHAWVPSLLAALLDRTKDAHKKLRDELVEGADVSEAEEDALLDLLDVMQAVFCEVALANTLRTARLCAVPQSLSYWALEILRDQGEKAVVFLLAYDNCSLGLNDLMDEEHDPEGKFKKLFHSINLASDLVVNRLLRVKQLLKLRRADEDQAAAMRPFSMRAKSSQAALGSSIPPQGGLLHSARAIHQQQVAAKQPQEAVKQPQAATKQPEASSAHRADIWPASRPAGLYVEAGASLAPGPLGPNVAAVSGSRQDGTAGGAPAVSAASQLLVPFPQAAGEASDGICSKWKSAVSALPSAFKGAQASPWLSSPFSSNDNHNITMDYASGGSSGGSRLDLTTGSFGSNHDHGFLLAGAAAVFCSIQDQAREVRSAAAGFLTSVQQQFSAVVQDLSDVAATSHQEFHLTDLLTDLLSSGHSDDSWSETPSPRPASFSDASFAVAGVVPFPPLPPAGTRLPPPGRRALAGIGGSSVKPKPSYALALSSHSPSAVIQIRKPQGGDNRSSNLRRLSCQSANDVTSSHDRTSSWCDGVSTTDRSEESGAAPSARSSLEKRGEASLMHPPERTAQTENRLCKRSANLQPSLPPPAPTSGMRWKDKVVAPAKDSLTVPPSVTNASTHGDLRVGSSGVTSSPTSAIGIYSTAAPSGCKQGAVSGHASKLRTLSSESAASEDRTPQPSQLHAGQSMKNSMASVASGSSPDAPDARPLTALPSALGSTAANTAGAPSLATPSLSDPPIWKPAPFLAQPQNEGSPTSADTPRTAPRSAPPLSDWPAQKGVSSPTQSKEEGTATAAVAPHTVALHKVAPHTVVAPHTAAPQFAAPPSVAFHPVAAPPHTAAPHTAAPHTVAPHTVAVPHNAAPHTAAAPQAAPRATSPFLCYNFDKVDMQADNSSSGMANGSVRGLIAEAEGLALSFDVRVERSVEQLSATLSSSPPTAAEDVGWVIAARSSRGRRNQAAVEKPLDQQQQQRNNNGSRVHVTQQQSQLLVAGQEPRWFHPVKATGNGTLVHPSHPANGYGLLEPNTSPFALAAAAAHPFSPFSSREASNGMIPKGASCHNLTELQASMAASSPVRPLRSNSGVASRNTAAPEVATPGPRPAGDSAASGSGAAASSGAAGSSKALPRVPGVHIPWSTLEPAIMRQIGKGGYGAVYYGQYHFADVAIKVLKIDRELARDDEAIKRFLSEVELQQQMSHHPNIVHYMGACCEYTEVPDSISNTTQGQLLPDPSTRRRPMLAIVMEFCRLGNVFTMVQEARKAKALLDKGDTPDEVRRARRDGYTFYSSWERRLEVLVGAAAGLAFMHSQGVIHRDLTSYNLLVDYAKDHPRWTAKVCDFNLSRVVEAGKAMVVQNSGNCNSAKWQSPELLSGERYGIPNDVFSFGVVLWEIITLRVPWSEDDMFNHREDVMDILVMNAVRAGDRLELPPAEDIRPPLPEVKALLSLTHRCWNHDPQLRPEMPEVATELQRILALIRDRKETQAREKHRKLVSSNG